MRIRCVEKPSFGQKDDELPLFADCSEVNDQVLECVERLRLASPRDHGVGNAQRLARRWIAGVNLLLGLVWGGRLTGLPPERVVAQKALDGGRAACEVGIWRRDLRRHDSNQR